MLNSLFVAKATQLQIGKTFQSGKTVEPDKNGFAPILLDCLAGRSINRSIISGTVANTIGIKPDCVYLVSVSETEPDDQYGRQFNFKPILEIGALDIADMFAKFGPAHIVDVTGKTLQQHTEPEIIGKRKN
jgi:hypothetical protein